MAAPSGSACSTHCWSPGSASSSRPIIGFVVGIARLSTNWLVAQLAAGYVETIRNMPLLLQILFWYNAVLKALPVARDSIVIPGGAFLNNRGLFLPRAAVSRPASARCWSRSPSASSRRSLCRVWARKRQERTGQQAPVVLVVLALVVGLPLVVFALAGFPLAFDMPQAGRFNFQRRHRGAAGIRRAAVRPVDLYRRLHRRDRARRHPVGVARADRGRLCARHAARPDPAAGRRAAGDARDRAAADQPVSQPDQEFVAGGGDRLSRLVRCSPARCSTRPARRSRSSPSPWLVYLTISLVTSLPMNIYNRRVALVER